MRSIRSSLTLALFVGMLAPSLTAVAQAGATNPEMEKFQQDLKAAVLNGSLTVAQVRELKTNAEVLKTSKERTPGGPVDLLTPYRAVSNMKTTMASVNPKDRETLRTDLQAVLAGKSKPDDPADPPTPGQKLGKDIFKAVMFGAPTEGQVKQLQASLNNLQSAKDQSRKLQQLRTLNESKSQIETVMNAGSFRPQDRQAVLDDLNNLGPQRGSRR